MERSFYIYKGFKEHLGNTRNYKQLSANRVGGRQMGLRYLLRDWIGRYQERNKWEYLHQ